MPDEPEARGLLALMPLHSARRAAGGDLIPLEEQDCGLWDQGQIAECEKLLVRALRMGRAGPFQIQAAIAVCHDCARLAAQTDWPQIAALYAELQRKAPTPVVALNRAVAIAMADGPEAAPPTAGRTRRGRRADRVPPAAGYPR